MYAELRNVIENMVLLGESSELQHRGCAGGGSSTGEPGRRSGSGTEFICLAEA